MIWDTSKIVSMGHSPVSISLIYGLRLNMVKWFKPCFQNLAQLALYVYICMYIFSQQKFNIKHLLQETHI